ncbi:hypothetical protein SKAU_G00065010 [Synaphobranchus kaupii]|uniref:Uncharacterized protein n=1 Tax=Synaphobranchus kaupii TaxID=118154 RepID=A0A9Q1G6K3_SYNKA|nr:hypothetical protein SKAU_G00065010 [Synaphobranchus kaupii]
MIYGNRGVPPKLPEVKQEMGKTKARRSPKPTCGHGRRFTYGQRTTHSCNSTRLCRMQVLLQPLACIADNLGRLAEAVERFVPATPSPLTSPSPLSTQSITRTLPPAAPGPSCVQPCRGGTRLQT